MVRAHSLLYAIYVCVIVAVVCAGLLYAANLYNMLNTYYNTHEELYIHNHSLVNYALGDMRASGSIPTDDNQEAIQSDYHTRPYGFLNLLVAHSIAKQDTVTSIHFILPNTYDNTCVYLTNINRGLSYSGKVVLSGVKKLPETYVRPIHIDNKPNSLDASGDIVESGPKLPDISKKLKESFLIKGDISVDFKKVVKGDSVLFNSFRNPLLELRLTGGVLENVNIKGNVVITGADSIIVKRTAILEDIIIRAPKIYFEEGYEGTLQAFADNKIETGKGVKLNYPSALCVNNTASDKGGIYIREGSRINGAVVLIGNEMQMAENNILFIEKEGLITGDVYCSGKLTLQSDVYGSVYTNWFVHRTASSGYDNCLADVEINIYKRPENFIPLPLFDTTKNYEAVKKVM